MNLSVNIVIAESSRKRATQPSWNGEWSGLVVCRNCLDPFHQSSGKTVEPSGMLPVSEGDFQVLSRTGEYYGAPLQGYLVDW